MDDEVFGDDDDDIFGDDDDIFGPDYDSNDYDDGIFGIGPETGTAGQCGKRNNAGLANSLDKVSPVRNIWHAKELSYINALEKFLARKFERSS